MKNYFMLFVLLLVWGNFSQAQEETTKLRLIGIDVGVIAIGNSSESSRIRETSPSFDPFYGSDFNAGYYSLSERTFVGVKYEMFTFKNRLGIAAGLRYSYLAWQLEGKENNERFFYWLASENELNTEVYRITNISQKAHYLGVPIEIRLFPWGRRKLVSPYCKLGGEINFRILTSKDVIFYKSQMDEYANEIEEQIGDPTSVHFSGYLSSGICIGRAGKTNFSIEFCAPFFTNATTGLFSSSTSDQTMIPAGIGVQFNLQIPINKVAK